MKKFVVALIWMALTSMLALFLGFEWNVKLLILVVVSGFINDVLVIFIKGRNNEA